MADQSFRIKNGLRVQDVLVINEQGSIASVDRLPEIPISKIANLQTALDEKSSATALEGVYDVTEYTDVQNETTFEIAYDVGLVQVLYNGVQLAQSDFTATNGTSVVLDVAVAKAEDIITIIRWGAVAESSIIVETPTANTAVKRTSTGTIRSANGVNSDEVVTKAQLDLKANLASPTLTGTPAAPTANAGTNTTQIATTAFVQTAVSGLVDAAPETLDTLNELAAALGDDPNFATTISTQIGNKLDANTWTSSAAANITSTQVTNWDTAYGWGDHGSAGYAPANTTVTTNTTQTIGGVKTFSNNAVFDGNVGIGTSSPASVTGSDYPPSSWAASQVYGGNNTALIVNANGGAARIHLVSGSASANQKSWNIQSFNGSLMFESLFDSLSGAERMRIDSAGNVGIGTSSPNHKLHSADGFYATGRSIPTNGSISGIQISYDTSRDAGVLNTWNSRPLIIEAYNDITFGTVGSERMKIDTNGVLNVGGVQVGRVHTDIMRMWRTADIQGYKLPYSDGGGVSYTWDNGTVRVDTSVGGHFWSIGKIRLPAGTYQLVLVYRPSPTQHGWNVYGSSSNSHTLRLLNENYNALVSVDAPQINKDLEYSITYTSQIYRVVSDGTFIIDMGTNPYGSGGYKYFIEAAYLVRLI